MLVTISYATAIKTNTTIEKKESPLFGTRTNNAIKGKIEEIVSRFIDKRMFFLPLQCLSAKINKKSTNMVGGPTELQMSTCVPYKCPSVHHDTYYCGCSLLRH